MPIAGMTALTAILAPVPISDDCLYRVGDGRIVAFVKVDGAVDGSVLEELTELKDVVSSVMTRLGTACVFVLDSVMTGISVGRF